MSSWPIPAEVRERLAKLVPAAGSPTTICGFTFPPDVAARVWQVISKQAMTLLAEQGPRALEMPRSAAIGHEAGHVVTAAHDGIKVDRVCVFAKDFAGQPVWGGWTYSRYPKMVFDENTPTADVLRRISCLIAGVVGEGILDPTGYRDGSSLDEVIVAQLLVDQLSQRRQHRGVIPQVLWNACWRRTSAIISLNERPARTLMAKLALTGTVRGTPLQTAMAAITRVSNDVLEVGAMLTRWGSE
jgi:hypothetical protein